MDEVFRALSSRHRRRLLDTIRERDGQTLQELCGVVDMTRQSASRHLAVLEDAKLVTTTWHGREKHHHLNAAAITEVTDRWVHRFALPRVRALDDLRDALQEPPMTTSFTYTTYVRTTAERLWEALTAPAFTRRYWGTELHSTWEQGATFTWTFEGVTVEDPDQVVLVADPPRELSYTWHTLTPELAEVSGVDEETAAAIRSEPRSRVTFTVEPVSDGLVRLDVVHEGFAEGSDLLRFVSQGWPAIIANLKTLLETGETLPDLGP